MSTPRHERARPVGFRAIVTVQESYSPRAVGHRAANRRRPLAWAKSSTVAKRVRGDLQASIGLMLVWQINIGLALTIGFYAVFSAQATHIEQFLTSPTFRGAEAAECIAGPETNWCAPNPMENSEIVSTVANLHDEGYVCTQTPFVAHRVVTESQSSGEVSVHGFDEAVKHAREKDVWAQAFCAKSIPAHAKPFTG